MAYSTQRATSDGTLAFLDISIDYLDRTEITVYYDDILSEDWSWVGDTEKRISFAVLPGGVVPEDVEVLVRRTTDISQLRHQFSRGAVFGAVTLDEALDQTLHIAQEAIEGGSVGDIYNNLNMHGYRLTNVGNAIDPGDAINLETWNVLSTTFLDEADAVLAPYQNAAEAAALAAAASFDSFDDRYLGAKAVAPTTDNDGNTLLIGAIYFDTTIGAGTWRAWNGTVWVSVPLAEDRVYKDSDTGGGYLPVGSTAQRGAAVQGKVRFNLTLNQFEGYNGTVWDSIGGGATGAPGNPIYHLNDQATNGSYTLPTGKNALVAGPLVISNGDVHTIPNGDVVTIP